MISYDQSFWVCQLQIMRALLYACVPAHTTGGYLSQLTHLCGAKKCCPKQEAARAARL